MLKNIINFAPYLTGRALQMKSINGIINGH